MTQTTSSKSAKPNSSEPQTEAVRTARKETGREVAMRLSSTDPKCKAAPKSGKGYVIGGVKG